VNDGFPIADWLGYSVCTAWVDICITAFWCASKNLRAIDRLQLRSEVAQLQRMMAPLIY
jgi:hypothetical protein